MNVCLPPKAVDSFKQALKAGKINPERLANMTSEARHKIFSDLVGEGNAKTVNSLFESKLLLKNQQRGYLTWAKSVANVNPEVRRTLEARIAKLDRVLSPTEEKAFLHDLASTKLGVDVTAEQAKQIANKSAAISEAEALPRSSPAESLQKGWTPSANDMKYGYAKYDLNKYVNDLKQDATRLRLSDLKTGRGAVQAIPRVGKALIDLTKSIGASLDDSFALRQGNKTVLTQNRAWRTEFKNSFVNIAKSLKDPEAAERELQAHLMADPVYDQAVKDGLAIKGNEDAIPTDFHSAGSKTGRLIANTIGRPFTATEIGYNAFAQHLRLQVYKNMMKAADKLDGDVPKDYGKNMATMTNSLTGKGRFGKTNSAAGPLNVLFYSASFLKSNIDTLLLHPLGSGVGGTADLIRGKEGATVVSAAQKTAAKNLAIIVAQTAGIMAVANQLMPGSVDYDPQSSNFGKIKVGDTRFDITGGMASIAELAAQIATQSTKSATTGVVHKLNDPTAYKGDTDVSIVTNFLMNKASPIGGVALDFGQGKDHNGNKPTIKSEAQNLYTPLGVKNYQELKGDPHSANILATVLADTFGISANTYGKTNKSGSQALSSSWNGLHQNIGDSKFTAALQEYNTKVDNFMADNHGKLDALSNTEKADTITAAKSKIEHNIFKEYDYKPAKVKPSQGKTSLLDSIK